MQDDVDGPALTAGRLPAIEHPERTLDLALDTYEIAARLATVRPPEPRYTTGVFARYAATVSSASQGAVLETPKQ